MPRPSDGKTIEQMTEECKEWLGSIYCIPIMKPSTKKEEKRIWKITSDELTTAEHYDKKKFRFQGDTLLEAMSFFYDYISERL